MVKLQAEAYNFTKTNTLPWVLFTFFKLYKWYQIAQRITNAYGTSIQTMKKKCSSSGIYTTRHNNGNYLLLLGKRKLESFEISYE